MSVLRMLLHLRELRSNQWMKLDELKKIQDKKLRSIVKYAYENVKFYHQRFDALGLKPEDIKTTKDLQKLPVTTRLDIQKSFPKEMLANGVSLEKCRKHVSSGSTGIPVTIVGDAKSEDYRAALFARPFLECGLRLMDRMVRITGTPQPADRKWYEHLGLMRKITVSPAEPVGSTLVLLADYKPNAIYGQSTYIFLLAKGLAEADNKDIKPRVVFTTAELMTRKMRSFVSSTFGTRVFDLYGCVEVERVAWECKQDVGYHMDIDSQVIEFVDGNEHVAPKERGRILLTCLYNYAMPLIRYDVGDVGTPSDEKCPCGRGLPLMKNIEGRVNDFIKLPDGRVISPMAFIYIDEIPGIAQFRVIQEKEDKIKVELVLEEHHSNETIGMVQYFVRNIVGKEIQIEVLTTEQISQEKSGKIRIVKSLLNMDKFI